MSTQSHSGRRIRTAATWAGVLSLLVSCGLLAQDGAWTTKTPMPMPRGDTALGTIRGILYIAGGGCPLTNGICTSSLAYNPKRDAWVSKAPLPFRTGSCAAVLEGKLYVIGGTTFSSIISDVVAYDPGTDTWITKAPMPTARFACAAGVVNGILYVAGGLNLDRPGAVAIVEAYDPRANSWTTKAPMPNPIAQAAAGVIGGTLYVAGGGPPAGVSYGVSPALLAYDPNKDGWSTKAPMLTPRALATGAVLGGKLYVVGGISSAANGLHTAEAYDPKSDAWSTEPDMPTGRFLPGAGVVDDVLYVLGGTPPSGISALDVNEAFSPFLHVAIDIKPGDASNTINLKSLGVVPVAILGSATFDPMTVDPTRVTLAGAPVATRGKGVPMTSVRDANHDGYPDLLLFFRTQDLKLSPTDTQAVLYGETFSGQRIRGSDSVRIVPPPKPSAALLRGKAPRH